MFTHYTRTGWRWTNDYRFAFIKYVTRNGIKKRLIIKQIFDPYSIFFDETPQHFNRQSQYQKWITAKTLRRKVFRKAV